MSNPVYAWYAGFKARPSGREHRFLVFKGRRPSPRYYCREPQKPKGSTSFPGFAASEGIRLIEEVPVHLG
jgi:hypothetical protein